MCKENFGKDGIGVTFAAALGTLLCLDELVLTAALMDPFPCKPRHPILQLAQVSLGSREPHSYTSTSYPEPIGIFVSKFVVAEGAES